MCLHQGSSLGWQETSTGIPGRTRRGTGHIFWPLWHILVDTLTTEGHQALLDIHKHAEGWCFALKVRIKKWGVISKSGASLILLLNIQFVFIVMAARWERMKVERWEWTLKEVLADHSKSRFPTTVLTIYESNRFKDAPETHIGGLVPTSSWPFPSAAACERPKCVPFTRHLPSISWTCCTRYSWVPLNQRWDPINHTWQSQGQDFSWDLTTEQKLMLGCSGLKGFSQQDVSTQQLAKLHPSAVPTSSLCWRGVALDLNLPKTRVKQIISACLHSGPEHEG